MRSPVDPADWVTLWQSELAALAVDREAHEALSSMAQLWATAGDGTPGRSGADAATGPQAAGDAPGVQRELAELRRRIAELERAAEGR